MKGSPHRQVLQILLFLLATVLILGSSTLIFRISDGFFLEVKKKIVASIEEQTQSKIYYSSISPSIFQYLELKNFTLYRQEDPDRPFFKIDRLKIYFNLWAIISNQPDKAVQEINIENSSFFMDKQRDKDFFTFVENLLTGPAANFPTLTLSGTNLKLSYLDEGQLWTGEEVFFRLEPGEPFYVLVFKGTVRGQDLELGGLTELSSKLSFRGRFNQNFSETQWEVHLQNFDSNYLSLNSQVFQLSWNKSNLKVVKIQDQTPMDFSYEANTSTGDWKAKIQSEHFDMAKFVTLKGSLKSFNAYLPQNVTTLVSLGQDQGEWFYSWNGRMTVNLPSPFNAVTASGRWSGDQKLARFPELNLFTNYGSLGFSGQIDLKTYLPKGLLNFKNIHIPGAENLNGLVRSRTLPQGELELYSENLSYGTVVVQNFLTQIKRKDLDLSWTSLISLENFRKNERNQVKITGEAVLGGKPKVEAVIMFDGLAMDPIYKQTGSLYQEDFSKILQPFSAFGNLGFRWSQNDWKLEAQNFSLRSAEIAGRNLFFTASVSSGSWNLKQLSFQWDDLRVQGSSQGSWNPKLDTTWGIDLTVNEIPYHIEGDYTWISKEVTFQGSYGMKGSAVGNTAGEWEYNLGLRDLPIQSTFGKSLVNLVSEGRLGGENWEAIISEFSLKGAKLGPLENYEISLAGLINPQQFNIFNLSFKDKWSQIFGRMVVDYRANDMENWKGQVQLQTKEGTEKFTVILENRQNNLLGELSLHNFPLGRLGQDSLRGLLNTDMTISGPLDDWILKGLLNIPDGRYNRDFFSLQLGGSFSFKETLLDSGQVKYLGNILNGIKARVNFDTGIAIFSGNYFGAFGKNLLTSTVNFEATLQEKISIGSLQDIFSDRVSGRISLTNTKNNNEKVDDFLLNFSKVKNSTTFRGGLGNYFQGRINDNGDFRIVLKDPFPITFTADGILGFSDINASFKDLKIDLSALGTLLDVPLVGLKGGQIQGNINVKGNPNNPEIFGEWNVKDLIITSAFLTSETKPLSTVLTFQGRKVILTDTPIEQGPGKALLNGDIYLEHWSIENYSLLIKIPEDTPLPVNYQLTGLDADGLVSGDLRVDGNLFKAILKGNLLIQDVNLALGITPESTPTGDYGFGVDLTLRTGKQVTFLWPQKNIPIIKAYVSANQLLRISVNENTSDFNLDGNIEIRGGDINLPAASFFLKQGFIRFKENNQKFDPWISVRGEQRRKDDKGAYTIIVIVDDYLSRFSTRFESSPARPQEEIMALVGNSIIGNNITNLNTYLSIASDIGISYLMSPIEDAVKKTFLLDLFTLRTQVFRKAIEGNIQGTRLSNQELLDNTSIFLGKYFGDLIYMEGLVSINLENNNIDQLTPELELGLEYITPFFLFNWRVTPKDPSSLFITDNEISFFWRLTY